MCCFMTNPFFATIRSKDAEQAITDQLVVQRAKSDSTDNRGLTPNGAARLFWLEHKSRASFLGHFHPHPDSCHCAMFLVPHTSMNNKNIRSDVT